MADSRCLFLSGAKGSYAYNHPDCGCSACSSLSAIAIAVHSEWKQARVDAELESYDYYLNQPHDGESVMAVEP